LKRDDEAPDQNKSERYLHEVINNPDAFKTTNTAHVPEQRGTRTFFTRETRFEKCDVSIKRHLR
jgi:hypothetical protein